MSGSTNNLLAASRGGKAGAVAAAFGGPSIARSRAGRAVPPWPRRD